MLLRDKELIEVTVEVPPEEQKRADEARKE
jgi:hypothetical protein